MVDGVLQDILGVSIYLYIIIILAQKVRHKKKMLCAIQAH
jgi:hypothetical protein